MESEHLAPNSATITVSVSGELVIPADIVRLRHWGPGTPIVAVDTGDYISIGSVPEVLKFIRTSFDGRDPVAELLAERREEVVKG